MKILKNLIQVYFIIIVNVNLFASPSIISDGQLLEINEATICHNAAVQLVAPNNQSSLGYVWMKNGFEIGRGLTYTIDGFNAYDQGEYKAISLCGKPNCEDVVYKLNFLDLGKDLHSSQSLTIMFDLPQGPNYEWSTGIRSNNFTATFEESTSVNVSLVTEFGCLIEDEIFITIGERGFADANEIPKENKRFEYPFVNLFLEPKQLINC